MGLTITPGRRPLASSDLGRSSGGRCSSDGGSDGGSGAVRPRSLLVPPTRSCTSNSGRGGDDGPRRCLGRCNGDGCGGGDHRGEPGSEDELGSLRRRRLRCLPRRGSDDGRSSNGAGATTASSSLVLDRLSLGNHRLVGRALRLSFCENSVALRLGVLVELALTSLNSVLLCLLGSIGSGVETSLL